MERLVKVWTVGRLNYSKGVKLQKYLAKLHTQSGYHNNTLLCVEHNPVYTTGLRSKRVTEDEVNRFTEKGGKFGQNGAEFHTTDRGGLITFHGPGQLVVYPILNLRHFQLSVRWYVAKIEATVIDLCKKFNLNAKTSPHTGVWIDDKKICAIGIRSSRYVTTHGLALNCSTDLSWFDHIVPCGIQDKGVTSLSNELSRTVRVQEALPKFLESFRNSFECSFVEFPKEEAEQILQSLD